MSRSGSAVSCSVVLVILSFAIFCDAQTALRFVPVTPCRTVDTRWPNGQFGGPPIPGEPIAVSPSRMGRAKYQTPHSPTP